MADPPPRFGPPVYLDGTVFEDIRNAESWRKEICDRHGLKPEIFEIGYSSRDRSCSSTSHPVTEFQRQKGISPYGFDPQCVGKPLLWNDGASSQPNAGYTIAFA